MTTQLQRLFDLGYPVEIIEAVGDLGAIVPGRWLYCAQAKTLFCHETVLEPACVLWPWAQVRKTRRITELNDLPSSPASPPPPARRGIALCGIGV